jgi:predicted TIM-barrel fold metal-dependent hydrolase
MPSLTRRQFLARTALLCSAPAWVRGATELTEAERAPLARAVKFPLIDAHLHYLGEHPVILQWLADNDVKLLNIAVAGQNDGWRRLAGVYRRLAREHPARYAWCTSFTLPDFGAADFSATAYQQRVLHGLEQDFADGALGCKLWKAVGMSIQKADKSFLQMDDPLFDPIYAWFVAHRRPLMVHIADPMSAWEPLDEKNASRPYYEKNPQWHMYGRKDRPHHSEIIAARDRVLQRHPKLRMIGAHLGSLEYDVDQLARTFAAHPNFAVDTSATNRIASLSRQGRQKVRAFFIAYQDRLLFGTDRVTQGEPGTSPRDVARMIDSLRTPLQTGWDYYATDKTQLISGQSCPGLALPEAVLTKLFYSNARRWFPGL